MKIVNTCNDLPKPTPQFGDLLKGEVFGVMDTFMKTQKGSDGKNAVNLATGDFAAFNDQTTVNLLPNAKLVKNP